MKHILAFYIALLTIACTVNACGDVGSTSVDVKSDQVANFNDPKCDQNEKINCATMIVDQFCDKNFVSSRAANCTDCPEVVTCQDTQGN